VPINFFEQNNFFTGCPKNFGQNVPKKFFEKNNFFTGCPKNFGPKNFLEKYFFTVYPEMFFLRKKYSVQ
jgi:hypothetical protein